MSEKTPPRAATRTGDGSGDGPGRGVRALPRGVVALGIVSLLMDVSSEMIHGLLPVFLVAGLGASVVAVGLIDGIAEATASLMKVFSGAWSDRLGARKALALAGYGLAALSKPLFPLASGAGGVLAARFIDRLGKGIRAAPRDALIADLTPRPLWGAAYGFRQSLDTAGAFLGLTLAVLFLTAFAADIRTVFWIAVLPAWLAVAVLALGVRDPAPGAASRVGKPARVPVHWRAALALGKPFWILLAIAAVLTLPKFSESFLILRGAETGLGPAYGPVVLVAMNAAYALSAYPAGRLSDRLGRRGLLMAGYALLAAANVGLALGSDRGALLTGALFWGLHLGFTQGLLAALVAEQAPPALRGTAFGIFHLAIGIVALLASLLAGVIWEEAGSLTLFWTGGALALVGAAAAFFLPASPRALDPATVGR